MTEVKENKWYVIRAISGQENKIKTYIEGEIKRLKIDSFVEDIIVPTQKVIQIRNGKKVSKEKVYFPGYIMIKANLTGEIPHIIRSFPNILGFLGHIAQKLSAFLLKNSCSSSSVQSGVSAWYFK